MDFPKPSNTRLENPMVNNRHLAEKVNNEIRPVQSDINKQTRLVNEYPDISNRIFDNVIEMQNRESNLTQYFQRPVQNIVKDPHIIPQITRNKAEKLNRSDDIMKINFDRYTNDFQDRFNGLSMVPKDTRIDKGDKEINIGRTMKSCASLPPSKFNR